MAKREDPEKLAAKREADSRKIVEGVAAQDFTDGIGTFHKAGEPVEISQDELDRLVKGGHKLIVSKRAFDARQELQRIENEEREAAAQELADAEAADDDQSSTETGSGAIATGRRKSGTSKSAKKRA